MRSATLRAAALATSAVLGAAVLGGCSTGLGGPSGSAAPTVTDSASPSASPSPGSGSATPSSSASAKKVRNDLEKRDLERVIRAGDFRVTVGYQTPDRKWTTSGDKTIYVDLSVRSVAAGADPKVYLQRTTVNLALYDASGSLDAPAALSDVATTSPGFLVNAPNSYGANFIVPSMNVGATELRMTFSFTLITQLKRPTPTDPDAPVDTSRDYTKQVATDVVVVPLTS